MKGLDIYNTKEGFTVAELHYSADPAKITATGEPIQELLEGYVGGIHGAAWRKEMEIDFTAYSGQLLCYDLIQQYRAKIVRHYEIKDWYYQYGSLDWGRNNPSAFNVYTVGEGKHVHTSYEIYRNQLSIPELSSLIKMCPYYDNLMWISADPSMWNKTQEEKEGARSLADKFNDEGIVLKKGASKSDEFAITELLDRWKRLDLFEPTFTIGYNCPKQIWEFERLRYKEITTAQIEKQNPHETLVDKDNHSWDNFKYFISTWLQEPTQENRKAPRGSVAWYEEKQAASVGDWRGKYK